ncbi:hypothetical protein [Actinophytocola sp.]|uniref:hypothetical protein n=1 Tax=Actinophytocola sp. TaxID=1872138 RepID=UPI002D7ED28C|nr:hypothetical protein [Actinophytocola sp.]HET9142708.1 hypothetical protein [Actinophytocola sp.]
MDGYTLDPDELTQLKGILHGASDQLGMKDFSEKATLEGFLTVQDVSPYENVEETVEELIRKLSQFANHDYPQVVDAMQKFINDAHTAIEDAADKAHQTAKDYAEHEDRGRNNFPN